MPNILLTILGILAPFILGKVLIYLFFRHLRLNLAEFFVLTFVLGSIFLTMFIFIFSFFNLSLTLIKDIVLCFSLFCLILLLIREKIEIHQIKRAWLNFRTNISRLFKFVVYQRIFHLRDLPIIFLIILIIFKIFFISSESLLRPILQYDAVATWSLKAKIFFLQNKVNLNPNQLNFVGLPYIDYLPGSAYVNYPLHLPLLQSWIALLIGDWSDLAIKIIFLLHYFGLLIIFYSNLHRYLSLIKTLIFTFFLTSLPFLVYHAIHDYLDLPLAFYLLGAMIYCWRGLKENNFSFLILGTLFAAGATWIKNEGFFLGLIILISVLICQLINKQFKLKFLFLALLFFIFQLPWLIFKFVYRLGFENIPGISFKPGILKIFFSKFITTINWNIWWLIFVLVLILNWRKIFNPDFRFMSLTVFPSIIFYLAIYVFTANAQFIVSSVIDQRNLLTITPLTVFYIAIFFTEKK